MLPRPLAIVLVVVALSWVTAIAAWPNATLALTFDDSFYYFEIASRFAAGQGSTFDGIHATNGYHPLWMWLASAAYGVGLSGDLAARALLVLQTLLACSAAGLALSILPWRQAEPAHVRFAALIVGAWLIVPMILRTHINGMESAVVVAVHAALLASVVTGDLDHPQRWSWPRWGAIGALLGVAILARSDAALLTPILGAALVWSTIQNRGKGWLGLAASLAVPAVVLFTFMAANQVWFDTPLQVSGTLKRVSPGPLGLSIIAGCMAAAGALWWLSRRGLGPTFPTLSRILRQTSWYGIFTLATTAYYTGLQTFARQWYFAPAVLWATLLLGALALDLAAKARADKPGASALASLGSLGAILVLPLLVGAAYTAYTLARPETLAVRLADRDAARWLDENLPAQTRVASWDAGLIGYTATVPIINLDGVVNDVDWLRALRTGTAGERLQREQIRWIVNHSFFEEGRCTSIDDSLARLDSNLADQISLVKAWPYEQVGSINGASGGRHQMATCVVELVQP